MNRSPARPVHDDHVDDATNAASISIIGLGAMGATLARAFLAAGHPTTVWNRTSGRADALAAHGATVASSLGEAVAASSLVVVCVLDADVVRSLLEPLGEELAGHAIVNLTSSAPEDGRRLAEWSEAHGVDYLDGAIMVPTPVIGTEDAFVLYSGSPGLFEAHRATLAAIGGDQHFLGDDAGLASLYDLGMLDVFFAGMTAFLHATALVEADGIAPSTFVPYAETIVKVLGGVLPSLAAEVEAAHYPGDQDTIAMEHVAVDHIVDASLVRGVDPTVPRITRDLLATALAQGHGGDTFARVFEQMRRQPSR